MLTSSDARPRYALDILSVLAAPEGTKLQFRYEKQYVADDLQKLIANGKAIGQEAIVAFVGKVATPDAYFLPVRLVHIMEVTDLANAYVIRFAAKKYPDITSWAREQKDIVSYGGPVLGHAWARYGKYFPPWAQAMVYR
jgi:hypothetical protein